MLEVAVQCRALPGQPESGDQGAFWWVTPNQLLVCLCDGIGHGSLAYEASIACLDMIEQQREASLLDIVQQCNQALRDTRGVAIGLCRIDITQQQLAFLGLGNIRAEIYGFHPRKLQSRCGILGNENTLEVSPTRVPFKAGEDLLLLATDGVRQTLPMQRYQRRILYPDLNLVVDELLQDLGSDVDDAGILVVR